MLLNNCRVCKSNTLCYFQKTYKNQCKINQNRSGQVNAYTFVEASKKFILLQRASRSLLRQVYVGLLNHQKTYKNLCKINKNQSALIKSSCWFILARPGSNMVRRGPSRRSMEVDVGQLGSSWAHPGFILGSSWLILGSCWVILGHLGLILGSS